MYSVTQGTNIAALLAAFTIFMPLAIKLVTSPLEMTDVEWSQLGASGTVLVTAAISFVNRFKKGDVTLMGSVKK